MSRDSRERRNGRRRLFVYRPSPDSLTSLTIQSQGLSPLKSNPSREQEGPGEWPPPTPRACGSQEGLFSSPFRGGATTAQQERPPKDCVSPSQQPPYLLPSPPEKTANRILPVELRDFAHQVPPYLKPPPDSRLPAGEGDDGGVGSSGSPSRERDVPASPHPADVLLLCTGAPSELLPTCPQTPPSSQPPAVKAPRWGLAPLFHSVRSKLESFADIFLSPMKSRRESQHALHSESMAVQTQQYSHCPEDGAEDSPSSGSSAKDPPDFAPCSPPREGAAVAPRMNLQLKIEICSPSSALCRPPLQRCLSCPLLRHIPHRHSLGIAEQREAMCSCRAPSPRRRRHSVGTAEEYRKLPLSPVFLSCLRKEKHPFALWPSRCPAGSVLPHASSSLRGCLDEERVGEGAASAGEGHVAEQSPARSCCQEVTSRKVSTIQIRKRVTRQEGSLTPLGLPKRIRLQKEDFSLEEIYTNKNYHTPTEKRKFETIFEEPVMKGGALILTSQRPLRRVMVFKDSGAPRRKRRRKGRERGRTRSGVSSAIGEVNIEMLLRHKLDQLEAALQHVEEAGLH